MPKHKQRRRRRALLITSSGAALMAALLLSPGAEGAPSSNAMPKGDLPGWRQIYADNFNGYTVPRGAFSDCGHNADTPRAYCGGLKRYPTAYTNYWAYPSGWEDTAKSGADGNGGAPYGGTYEPQKTISIGKGYDGGGTLKVAMYRPANGGNNVVGTVVPRRCMDLRDGRYSARVKVTRADAGFKSAWLRYEGNRAELDYPEVDDYRGGNVAAHSHGGSEWNVQSSAYMTDAHTYTWERRGNTVTVWLDGKKLRTGGTSLTTSSYAWQNESRIIGDRSKANRGYAAPGAKATVEVSWATCYVRK